HGGLEVELALNWKLFHLTAYGLCQPHDVSLHRIWRERRLHDAPVQTVLLAHEKRKTRRPQPLDSFVVATWGRKRGFVHHNGLEGLWTEHHHGWFEHDAHAVVGAEPFVEFLYVFWIFLHERNRASDKRRAVV